MDGYILNLTVHIIVYLFSVVNTVLCVIIYASVTNNGQLRRPHALTERWTVLDIVTSVSRLTIKWITQRLIRV